MQKWANYADPHHHILSDALFKGVREEQDKEVFSEMASWPMKQFPCQKKYCVCSGNYCILAFNYYSVK